MRFTRGDLTLVSEGFILHQVNCMGSMRAGLAKALSDKWPGVKTSYQRTHRESGWKPGDIGIVTVSIEPELHVVNCASQFDFGDARKTGLVYTDYDAVAICFEKFRLQYRKLTNGDPLNIWIPYLYGCGLAGGSWDIVFALISQYFSEAVIVEFSPGVIPEVSDIR